MSRRREFMLSTNKLRKINIALLSTTLLCCVGLNQSFADYKTDFYNDPALAEKYKRLSDNQRLKSLHSGRSTKPQTDLKICGAIKNTSQKIRIKSIDL